MIHFIQLTTEAKVSIGIPIRDDMFFCDHKQDGLKKTKTKIVYKNTHDLEFLVVETVAEIIKQIDRVRNDIIDEEKKHQRKWHY